MLPAREGDAILVRWGEEHSPYQMLVDMGGRGTGKSLMIKLAACPIRSGPLKQL